jgi:hypothetical protein
MLAAGSGGEADASSDHDFFTLVKALTSLAPSSSSTSGAKRHFRSKRIVLELLHVEVPYVSETIESLISPGRRSRLF